MATFYVGSRPVLGGRNVNNFIHSTKNKVGTYSYWQLQDQGSKLLAGAPDNEYALGTRKHARILEYIYSGKPHVAPMARAGGNSSGTARQPYNRFRPLEYKGLTASAALGNVGHAIRDLYYSQYSNYTFDGVPSADAMTNVGHVRRFSQSYGGAFNPYVWNGVPSSSAMPGTIGQALPATAMTSNYGHNKVNEWRGVPSSKAL